MKRSHSPRSSSSSSAKSCCAACASAYKRACRLARQLRDDEAGGEVLEYALVAGLVVVAAIAVITSVGNKVLARWQSLDSSM